LVWTKRPKKKGRARGATPHLHNKLGGKVPKAEQANIGEKNLLLSAVNPRRPTGSGERGVTDIKKHWQPDGDAKGASRQANKSEKVASQRGG